MQMVRTTKARIEPGAIERAAPVIRILGHPLRLRILEVLEDGPRPVMELVTETGASQATVSQQLAILRAAGVVGARRDGPRVWYTIVEPKVSHILACIRECDTPTAALMAAGPLARLGVDGNDGRRLDGRRLDRQPPTR